VIVDSNPMHNLHDPFLLYVALHPSGRNPRKIRVRAGHSMLSAPPNAILANDTISNGGSGGSE
jgi:hypothetical protein